MQNGAETEADYAYTGVDGTCSYNQGKAVVKPTGFTDVDKSDNGLLTALQEGPVSIAVCANTWWQL